AWRSAIAVSCGSVLTVDRPCVCRYREIISAMSSACASVDVIATTAPSKTVFIALFPSSPAMKQHSLAPDEADIGRSRRLRQRPLQAGAPPWRVRPAPPPPVSTPKSSSLHPPEGGAAWARQDPFEVPPRHFFNSA